jgi:hypothetical protein
MYTEAAKLRWKSHVYECYNVEVIVAQNRIAHQFECKMCTHKIKRYQDTGDKNSTGNLANHAVQCYGEEEFNAMKERKKNSTGTLTVRLTDIRYPRVALSRDQMR